MRLFTSGQIVGISLHSTSILGLIHGSSLIHIIHGHFIYTDAFALENNRFADQMRTFLSLYAYYRYFCKYAYFLLFSCLFHANNRYNLTGIR